MAKKAKAKRPKIPKALRRPAKKVRKTFSRGRLKGLAKKLGISGRSKMKKKDLVDGIQKAIKKARKV
jgi:hypothetical protein